MSETATVPRAFEETTISRPPARSRFYIGAAVFVIVLNAAGFGPSFIDQSRRVESPTWLVAAHAAAASAWLLLFLAQVVLVASRRTTVHRRIGVAGPFLALAFIALGSLTTIDMARRGYDLSGDLDRVAVAPGAPALPREEYVASIFVALHAFANFGVLTGLGLWFRNRPEVHKRLMLLALGSLVITPVIHLCGHLIGRWPELHGPLNLAVFIVPNALLFAVAAHDKLSRGRMHPLSVWVPVLLIVETFGLAAVVTPSAGWHRLAMWLVS